MTQINTRRRFRKCLAVGMFQTAIVSSMFACLKCGAECLEDVVGSVKRKKLKIRSIVVVQTHGRSGRYNPHLHITMTSGGILVGWFSKLCRKGSSE